MAYHSNSSIIKICQIVVLASVSLLTSSGHLAANESILADSEAEAHDKKPIDWSKPIVSRGFGYEADNDKNQQFETKYKQAQIAYFFGEYKKAFTLWQPLAAKGHVESQASLAWLYHSGLGVETNYATAYDLYKKAAKNDNAVAQNNLGVLHDKGQYVRKDLAKARHWFKLSAENGYRFAQFNYANFLAEGLGGDKDIKNAIYWFQKAAEQNVKQAKEKLDYLNAKKSEK